MKAFYKELLKREGGKRNLTAADISEVMKHAADMITEPSTSAYMQDFEKYLAKKMEGQGKLFKVQCFIGFRASPRPRKKKK